MSYPVLKDLYFYPDGTVWNSVDWVDSTPESYIMAPNGLYVPPFLFDHYCAKSGYYRCPDCGKWTDRRARIYTSDYLNTWSRPRDSFFVCRGCAVNYPFLHGFGRCSEELFERLLEHSDRVHECDQCCDVFYEDSDSVINDIGCFCTHDCAIAAGYYQCHECGEWFEQDEIRNGCCDDCWETRNVEHSYSHTPYWHVYGNGGIHMGVELEVDGGGDKSVGASVVGNESECFLKHDGSLNDGFELVTHPANLDHHIASFPWKMWTRKLRDAGFRSHYTDTCGLHIHVSRDDLGDTATERGAAYFTLIRLVQRFKPQFETFARRRENGWCYYPNCEKTLDDVPKADKGQDMVEQELDHDRYRALNFHNYDTVEFRIFRGSLNLETIYATLAFVDGVCRFAKQDYDEQYVESVTWDELVDWIRRTCSLGVAKGAFQSYLERRNLAPSQLAIADGQLDLAA